MLFRSYPLAKAAEVKRFYRDFTRGCPDELSAVLGILTGTETTKLKVATGEYNKMIDQRIAEIKATCGLQ